MTDPVSVTGLVIAVAQVLTCIYDYGMAVKEARSDISRIGAELFALKGVLESLQALGTQNREHDGINFRSAEFQELVSSSSITLKSLEKRIQIPKSGLGKVMHVLKWPLDGPETARQIAHLDRLKSSFILIFMRGNTSDLSEVLSTIRGISQDLKEDREQREKSARELKERLLLDWLSPSSSSHLHTKAYSNYQHGTGQWFLAEFEKWINTEESAGGVLWLSGHSGAGKTTLVSHVIEQINSEKGKDDDVGVIYYYFSFSDAAGQSSERLLLAAAAQLAARHRSIMNEFMPIFERDGKTSQACSLTADQIIPILTKQLTRMRISFLFVDAINETKASTDVIRSLLILLKSVQNLRVVVASTAAPVLPDLLASQRFLHIKMNVKLVDQDIASTVSSGLMSNPNLTTISEPLKHQIQAKLVSNANGSFRWAQLVLSELCLQRTNRAIQDTLAATPITLNAVYESMLSRISSVDQPYVRRALLWLSFCERPLSLEELNEVAVLEESFATIGDDDRLHSSHFLLEVCHGIIDHNNGHVYLAHSSVRSFLISEWIKGSGARYFALDETCAHAMIMRLCLTYLLFTDFRLGTLKSSTMILHEFKQFPLLRYTVHLWPAHAYDLAASDYERLDAFFQTRKLPHGGNFTHWIRCLLPYTQLSHIQQTQPLYYAASFGMRPIVEYLLKDNPEVDIDAPGGRFMSSPLIVAAYRGHVEVVECLLKAGADPGRADLHHSTALHWAQMKGWRAIKDLLIRRRDLGLEEFRRHCERSNSSEDRHDRRVVLSQRAYHSSE